MCQLPYRQLLTMHDYYVKQTGLYRISHILVRQKKSFKKGNIVVKQAFTIDSLFGGFKDKPEIINSVKDLQLSQNTVTRHNLP